MKNNSWKWQQSKGGVLSEYSHSQKEKGGDSLKDEDQSYSEDLVHQQMQRPVSARMLLRGINLFIQRR